MNPDAAPGPGGRPSTDTLTVPHSTPVPEPPLQSSTGAGPEDAATEPRRFPGRTCRRIPTSRDRSRARRCRTSRRAPRGCRFGPVEALRSSTRRPDSIPRKPVPRIDFRPINRSPGRTDPRLLGFDRRGDDDRGKGPRRARTGHRSRPSSGRWRMRFRLRDGTFGGLIEANPDLGTIQVFINSKATIMESVSKGHDYCRARPLLQRADRPRLGRAHLPRRDPRRYQPSRSGPTHENTTHSLPSSSTPTRDAAALGLPPLFRRPRRPGSRPSTPWPDVSPAPWLPPLGCRSSDPPSGGEPGGYHPARRSSGLGQEHLLPDQLRPAPRSWSAWILLRQMPGTTAQAVQRRRRSLAPRRLGRHRRRRNPTTEQPRPSSTSAPADTAPMWWASTSCRSSTPAWSGTEAARAGGACRTRPCTSPSSGCSPRRSAKVSIGSTGRAWPRKAGSTSRTSAGDGATEDPAPRWSPVDGACRAACMLSGPGERMMPNHGASRRPRWASRARRRRAGRGPARHVRRGVSPGRGPGDRRHRTRVRHSCGRGRRRPVRLASRPLVPGRNSAGFPPHGPGKRGRDRPSMHRPFPSRSGHIGEGGHFIGPFRGKKRPESPRTRSNDHIWRSTRKVAPWSGKTRGDFDLFRLH